MLIAAIWIFAPRGDLLDRQHHDWDGFGDDSISKLEDEIKSGDGGDGGDSSSTTSNG